MAVARPLSVFPPDQLRFWADDGVGFGLFLVTLVALIGGIRRHEPTLAFCTAVPVGAFLGACVFGYAMFPSTGSTVWLLLSGVALLWGVPSVRLMRRHGVSLLGVVVGMAGGTLHLAAKRPAPAMTHPQGTWPLPEGDVFTDTLELPCGSARVELKPTLAFSSTSRDGFWPGLSTPDELQGEPGLTGAQRRSSIHSMPTGFEVSTQVPHDVASHLNRFTDLRVMGVKEPRIRFGGTTRVHAFLPVDYPTGRPAQFAFVRAGSLVVARATDAEKGPFIELERAPIESLSFTLLDGPKALCTLTFRDFVSQADVTTLSPTAGEGMPPNVVQFGIPATGEPIPAVHLSLAETAIGAGLETVRHAAGVYRNRIELTPE